MDKRDMNLDLDDLWPPASELVGLQFQTAEEFARAQEILGEDLDVYRWIWTKSRIVGIRKRDAHLFHEAGLSYTEVEIGDLPANPSKEQRAQERERLKQAMAWWLDELGWAK